MMEAFANGFWPTGLRSRDGQPGAASTVMSVFGAALVALGFVVLAAAKSPWIALGAVAGGAIVLSMFLSPAICFYLVALSLPLERIGRLTEDFSSFTISLSRIVGLIALMAFLLHVLIQRRRIRFGMAFWLYAGYTALAALGILWALQEKDALRDTQRIIGNLLFFFLIINIATRYSMLRIGVMVWLMANVGSAGYAAYSYHFSSGSGIEESEMGSTGQRFTAVVSDGAEESSLGGRVKRAYGTTSHPGVFGLNLVMTLPFFAWVMRGRRAAIQLLWAAGFGLCLYGIFLSNTRFVFVIAVLVLAWTVLSRMWDVPPLAWVALVLAGVSAVPLLPGDFVARTLDPSLYSSTKSNAIRIRFKMLDKSIDLLTNHWLLGIGVGNQDIIPAMITDEQGGRITPDGQKASAHNEFVWTMVEVGLFGWLLHFAFVGVVIWASLRAGSVLKRMRDPESQEQFWLLKAVQITLIAIPLFGVQSEVFHFALKGWWFAAGIAWVFYLATRRISALPSSRQAEAAA